MTSRPHGGVPEGFLCALCVCVTNHPLPLFVCVTNHPLPSDLSGCTRGAYACMYVDQHGHKLTIFLRHTAPGNRSSVPTFCLPAWAQPLVMDMTMTTTTSRATPPMISCSLKFFHHSRLSNTG